MTAGMGGVLARVDMGAAFALACAEGCSPRLAPELLGRVAAGLAEAEAILAGDGPAGDETGDEAGGGAGGDLAALGLGPARGGRPLG